MAGKSWQPSHEFLHSRNTGNCHTNKKEEEGKGRLGGETLQSLRSFNALNNTSLFLFLKIPFSPRACEEQVHAHSVKHC